MADNVKIRTEDVVSIKDVKILASANHATLGVTASEDYNSVLSKIALRTPSLPEKQALEIASSPSVLNPFVTRSQLVAEIAGKIPWKTIGNVGSGSDYEGDTHAVFITALASGSKWFRVQTGVYTFTNAITIPSGVTIVGSSAASTVIHMNGNFVFSMSANCVMSHLTFQKTGTSAGILISADKVSLEYVVTHHNNGNTCLDLNGATNTSIFNCAVTKGSVKVANSSAIFVHGCFIDSLATNAIDLDTSANVSFTTNIISTGKFYARLSTEIRAIGNHFEQGTDLDLASSVILRANTPNNFNNNNEDKDFANLLSYIGSPTINSVSPPFSNNYAGPAGEDLTTRVSALDLLLQWRFEERNFHLTGDTSSTTITWDGASLTFSEPLRLYTFNKTAYWSIPAVTGQGIPLGWGLYVVLNRTLDVTNITLNTVLAPLGSIPNDRNNRQVFVLAFNVNGVLWWRGGNGSRLPSGTTGNYFVDGTSKNLLTYLGTTDYNISNPSYTSHFAGIAGESLTVRLSKTDALLKQLYAYSNLSTHLSDNGFFTVETNVTDVQIVLTGRLTLTQPHLTGRHFIENTTWNLAADQILYLTLSENLSGIDVVAASTVSAFSSLPLPDSYPLTTKYFVLARRVGTNIIFWDGTKVPVKGRLPAPSPTGRKVVPTAEASAAIMGAKNTHWDGTNLYWQNLAVTCSTGLTTSRNSLPDQITASSGLTNLLNNEGLLITHNWNSGSNDTVTIQKIALPYSSVLLQNQFIWAQRRNGYILFD